jgi:hypothetical protein
LPGNKLPATQKPPLLDGIHSVDGNNWPGQHTTTIVCEPDNATLWEMLNKARFSNFSYY